MAVQPLLPAPDNKAPEPDTSSSTSWAYALAWLETCQTEHPACNPPAGKTFTPTRLLDIARSPDTIYVVSGEDLPPASPYATLSHCWGKEVPNRLLPDNVDALREEGLPVASLSRTFGETVEVARRLGVSYLWIDSLCIIQESREDWAREAVRMADVYGHALVDIAATDSADGKGGLFRARDARAVEPCVVDLGVGGGKRLRCLVSDFEEWWQAFETAPLNVRAWVMQERLLSPRVLHFDRDQLVWECAAMVACERHPAGLRTPLPVTESVRRFRAEPRRGDRPGGEDGDGDGRGDVAALWAPIVRAYSACKITFDTDRLIALHGIATKVREKLACRYVAGLWMRALEAQLAWHVAQPSSSHRPKKDQHVAPSWSWASVVGEVTLFPRTNTMGFEDEDEDEEDEAPGGGRLCSVIKVRNPDGAETETHFSSHEILTVACYLLPVTIIPVSRDDWDGVVPGENKGSGIDDGEEDSNDGGGVEEADKQKAEDEEGEEGDFKGDDVEGDEYQGDYEEKAPWVILHRDANGNYWDIFVEREDDVTDEWFWKTPQERWLMPTWSSPNLGFRGLELERRPEDDGKFRRCGAFECRQAGDFWDSCLDFMEREVDGLEKCRSDAVLEPVLDAQEEEYEYSKHDGVEQFVLSII